MAFERAIQSSKVPALKSMGSNLVGLMNVLVMVSALLPNMISYNQ